MSDCLDERVTGGRAVRSDVEDRAAPDVDASTSAVSVRDTALDAFRGGTEVQTVPETGGGAVGACPSLFLELDCFAS